MLISPNLKQMMLLEEGNFTLNSPVSQFIPEFATMKVFVKENADGTIETEPLKTPVTIRHLMTHTSGMPYGFSPIEVIDRLFIAQREKSLKANGGPKNSAEVVADLIEVPLAFQPGTKWRYGMNIEVLGRCDRGERGHLLFILLSHTSPPHRIVEIISGKNLGEFCKERIFEPLGMVDTDFFCPPEKLDRVVPIYAHAMDPKTFQKVPGAPLTRKEPLWPLSTSDPAFHSGGGGLCSTLDDYAKFAQMMVNGGQLNGKRFLSPTTVALWSENHTPLEALPYQFPTRPVQYGKGYSLATYVVMDPAMNGIQTPKGSYSWSGAWSTHMWIDPSNKLYGVLLMHHDPAGYYETDNQFQQLVSTLDWSCLGVGRLDSVVDLAFALSFFGKQTYAAME